MNALMLAMLLTQAPGGDGAPGPEPPPSEADSYDQARERVRAAVKLANRDPRAGAELLEAALEQLSSHSLELSKDELALQERAFAQLALARSYLALDNAGAAERAMDRALRTALDAELPVDRYGPNMIALRDARKQALEDAGRVTLDVQCYVRCRLIIGGRASDSLEVSLYAGTYDVLIVALEGDAKDFARTLSFDVDEHIQRIDFAKPEAPRPVVDDEVFVPAPVDKPVRRAMPRWAEIAIMTAGAGAAILGGVMWSYDNRCPGGQDPRTDFADCPQVYDTRKLGLGLTMIGAGVFAVGGLTLVIDEVRVNRTKQRELSVVWTMSF